MKEGCEERQGDVDHSGKCRDKEEAAPKREPRRGGDFDNLCTDLPKPQREICGKIKIVSQRALLRSPDFSNKSFAECADL